MTYTDIIRHTF